MKRFYFIGLGLLLSFIIIGSFTLLDNLSSDEGKVITNRTESDQDNLGEMAKELADFITDSLMERDINGRLVFIQNDIENRPKLLIYIDTVADNQKERGIVETEVNDIVQIAKDKSILPENFAFEIIVKEQGKIS